MGPCGPLVLCHSPTWILKVTSGWKQPPQPLPCAVYTPVTWLPDRRGLTEPRASRAGLAGDRALAVLEVGKSRGRNSQPPADTKLLPA